MKGLLYIEVSVTDPRGRAGDSGRPARSEAMGRTGQRGLLPRGGCAPPLMAARWDPFPSFFPEVEHLDFYMELVGTKLKIPPQVTQT